MPDRAARLLLSPKVVDRWRQMRCFAGMHSPEYYREQAQRARRLAETVHQSDLRKTLRSAAQDFEEIAADLDAGAIRNLPPRGAAAAAWKRPTAEN
jgi:hypothetical protein